MAHINVIEKNENPNIRFIDKIYLTEDKSAFVSLNGGVIVYMDKEGITRTEHCNTGTLWFSMLSYLIENNDIVVGPEVLFEKVYGGEAPFGVEAVLDNQIKEIRRRNFYKCVKDKGFRIKKHSANDYTGAGYSVILPAQRDNVFKTESIEESVPQILTDSVVAYANEKNIIHREIFVSNILNALNEGEKNILICGFGGVGKTSVAKVLYSKFIENELFDNVGWIDYKGDLKTSMLTSLVLFKEEKNVNNRWNAITSILKKTKNKKILIIDNVDTDERKKQNPDYDEVLKDITNWPNMTIIITSRIERLDGFRAFHIGTLGDKENPKPCLDLFYHYNSNIKTENEIVEKLIDLCGYHTYAIEILAKSSKYQTSLQKFYNNIKEQGYQFPTLNIKTSYKNYNTTALMQLKFLFDITTISKQNVQILINFAVLPDMEKVSEWELYEWFSYNVNDVDVLINTGWMQYDQGYFYIHPLVKESVLLEYKNEGASNGIAVGIIEKLLKDDFWNKMDKYSDIIRKINIAESVLKYVEIVDKVISARLALSIADMARSVGNRLVALRQYELSEARFRQISELLSEEQQRLFWKAKYYLGYILSYTNNTYAQSEKFLREALALSLQLEMNHPNEKNKANLGKSWDHLGYILSNSERCHEEAELCLREAYKIRKDLYIRNPEKYMQEFAWTCDNLGYFLSLYEKTQEESENLLETALNYRLKLTDGEPSSEVAWTCSNLANVYITKDMKLDEAEILILKALDIYQALELIKPRTHYAGMAYISNNYGILLIKLKNRMNAALQQFQNSLCMYHQLEDDYPESYFMKEAIVCNNIAGILQLKGDPEAESYYKEALKIISKRNNTNSYDKYLDDIYYNLGIYFGKIQGQSLIFYVLCGAREKRIWLQIEY